jgi:ABC-type multidrug transport system fused ATPase/permease subunit
VLAYGGLAVLGGVDSLTVGGLVTFQMYWNMLSSSFQSAFEQFGEFSKVERKEKKNRENNKCCCFVYGGDGSGAARAVGARETASRGSRGRRARRKHVIHSIVVVCCLFVCNCVFVCSGTVELRDVVFRYKSRRERVVLDHVSLELRPGKVNKQNTNKNTTGEK